MDGTLTFTTAWVTYAGRGLGKDTGRRAALRKRCRCLGECLAQPPGTTQRMECLSSHPGLTEQRSSRQGSGSLGLVPFVKAGGARPPQPDAGELLV